MNDTEAFLLELAKRGIQISLEGSRLKIQAPKGILTPGLRNELDQRRGEMIAMLRGPDRAVAGDDRASKLDFSLFFFANEDGPPAPGKYRMFLEAAGVADRRGFAGVWTPERHFHPMGGLFPNPAIAAAALATITRNVKLRAGSVVLPLHDPLEVAEQWAMVDNLSGGRVELSFASGWHANDFVLAPERYAERKHHMVREIDTVRRLWRGESVRRRDGADDEIEVRIRPLPVQRELPVWLTAIGNPDSFRTAAQLGANLLTCLLSQDIPELAAKIALYRRTLAEHGFDPQSRKVSVFLHTYVGEDTEAVRERVREPFSRYLSSTLDLIGPLAQSAGASVDPRQLATADRDALLAMAFDRYFTGRTLMGSIDTCVRRAEQLAAAGADEVACLIDFGLAAEEVLAGLERLAVVKDRCGRSGARP